MGILGQCWEIMLSMLTWEFYMGLDIAKYLVKAKLKHPNPKLHTTAITYAKNNRNVFQDCPWESFSRRGLRHLVYKVCIHLH